MTDTPINIFPLNADEQSILHRLVAIRETLRQRKWDKTTYVRSQDVVADYNAVIEQVRELSALRKTDRWVPKDTRVDYVIEDCFQLISLLSLTVGKNKDKPALYSLSCTVKRLLDHLDEAEVYSQMDLKSIEKALVDMRDLLNVRRNPENFDFVDFPDLVQLLDERLSYCEQKHEKLSSQLSKVPPELGGTYESLVSILRSTSAANARHDFDEKEVLAFKQELESIQAKIDEENLVDENDTIVRPLLSRCLAWSDLVLERRGQIDERFQEQYNSLVDIRDQLDRISVTKAWSLRPTDLYNYQRMLDKYDDSRVDGNFLDADRQPADLHARRTLLHLVRRGYSLIYSLLIYSEPVSEALLPIFNQLRTLRKCLVEVKDSHAITNSRELYPYSMKLNSIDGMRLDGKFYVGKEIPEGQGILNQLLAECYDLCYEIRVNTAEAETEDAN